VFPYNSYLTVKLNLTTRKRFTASFTTVYGIIYKRKTFDY